MVQDGLASFEPAYVDKLALILRWSFDHMQRSGGSGDDAGGSVHLRPSTRSLAQPQRQLGAADAADVIAGAYWVRRPGPNAKVVIAYAGTVALEAVEAIGLIAEDRRDVGLLAVTSADRLHGGWTLAQRAREQGGGEAASHVERLLAALPRHCGLVTVIDAHPAILGWLGSVHGHRTHNHLDPMQTRAELYATIDYAAYEALDQSIVRTVLPHAGDGERRRRPATRHAVTAQRYPEAYAQV